jgi:hypothetical protein
MTKEKRVEIFLLIFAAAFLGLRFFMLTHSTFVTDEPANHLVADEYFAAGRFPFTNARGSQVHIPYGAGALWFYMFFRLFTWNPLLSAYAHTTFFSFGFLFFYLAVKKAYSRITAAWVVLFATSSLFLFELSRHPWDNTFFVPIGGVVLYLLASLDSWRHDPAKNRRKIYGAVISLSVVLAFALNVHIMSTPLIGSSGLMVLYILWLLPKWSLKERAALFGGFGFLFLLLIIPYVHAAIVRWDTEPMHSNVVRNAPWGDGRNLWWLFLRSMLYSSVWSTKYLFEPHLKEFYRFIGPVAAFLHAKDIIGWFAKLAAYGFLVATVISWIKGKRTSILATFAVVLWISFLIMMQYSNIPTDPHHFITLWWIVFLGAIVMKEKMRPQWRKIFTGIIAVNIFVNALLCVLFLAFNAKNSGIHNMTVGLGLKYQLEAVREGCLRTRKLGLSGSNIPWDIHDVGELQHSMRYMVRHMPECLGLAIIPYSDEVKIARLVLVRNHPETADASVHWEER